MKLFFLVFFLFNVIAAQQIHAQTTVTVGGFDVQFWDQANGNSTFSGNTIAQNQLGSWSPEQIEVVKRAFQHWADRLNVNSATNRPVIRVVLDLGSSGGDAIADSSLEDNGGTIVTDTYSRLVNNVTTNRTDGLDGQIVFNAKDILFDLDRMTQIGDGLSLEQLTIHEIGHLLGLSQEHDPFSDRISSGVFGGAGNPSTTATNLVTQGQGIPIDSDGNHTLLDFQSSASGMGSTGFRNVTTFGPAELAALADMGWNINLNEQFGDAIYADGTGLLETNTIDFTSSSDFSIGHFVQADNRNITYTGTLTQSGYGVTGIRLAGHSHLDSLGAPRNLIGNTITISESALIKTTGQSSAGIIVSSGANNVLVVRGKIEAFGQQTGILIDFGTANSPQQQVTSSDYNAYLVDRLDISGTVRSPTAIYLGPTAAVREINFLRGAKVNGIVRTDSLTTDQLARPTITFGRAMDSSGQATSGSDDQFYMRHSSPIAGLTAADAWMVGGHLELNGPAIFESFLVTAGLAELGSVSINTTTTVLGGELRLISLAGIGTTIVDGGKLSVRSVGSTSHYASNRLSPEDIFIRSGSFEVGSLFKVRNMYQSGGNTSLGYGSLLEVTENLVIQGSGSELDSIGNISVAETALFSQSRVSLGGTLVAHDLEVIDQSQFQIEGQVDVGQNTLLNDSTVTLAPTGTLKTKDLQLVSGAQFAIDGKVTVAQQTAISDSHLTVAQSGKLVAQSLSMEGAASACKSWEQRTSGQAWRLMMVNL